MSETVSDRDLLALMNLVEEGRRAHAFSGMPTVILELLRALVPCDVVSFNDMAVDSQTIFHSQDYPTVAATDSTSTDDPDDQLFWMHYWPSLYCSYPSRSGDERSVTTISDFYSHREWHSTGMYIDCLKIYGVEREAMFCLSAPPGRSRRVLLERSRGIDFDGRDRILLSLLRPHLSELYQELERSRHPTTDLTPRQTQVLRLVAEGYSNREIAKSLRVSPATVRTHLEHIFKQLNVTSRTAAAARAFPSPPY
jgi:DNA-binding CsgD family transcriptional regulator